MPTYDPLFEGTTDVNGNVELDIENTHWRIDVTADGYERLQTSVDYSGAEEGETFEEIFELQPADDGGDDTDGSESSAFANDLGDRLRSLAVPVVLHRLLFVRYPGESDGRPVDDSLRVLMIYLRRRHR